MFKKCAVLICIFIVYKTVAHGNRRSPQEPNHHSIYPYPRPNIYITPAVPRFVVPQSLWNVISRVIQYTEPRDPILYQQSSRQHKSISQPQVHEHESYSQSESEGPSFSEVQTVGDIPLGRNEIFQQFEPTNVNFIPKTEQLHSPLFSQNQPKVSIIKAQEIGEFIRNDPIIINDERLAQLEINQPQYNQQQFDQPQYKIDLRQSEIEQPQYDLPQISQPQYEINLRQSEIEQPQFDNDEFQFDFDQPQASQSKINQPQFESSF